MKTEEINNFDKWLRKAQPNDQYIYYHGNLACESYNEKNPEHEKNRKLKEHIQGVFGKWNDGDPIIKKGEKIPTKKIKSNGLIDLVQKVSKKFYVPVVNKDKDGKEIKYKDGKQDIDYQIKTIFDYIAIKK